MEFDYRPSSLPGSLPSLPVPGFEKPTFGQRAVERVTTIVGSWTFILVQSGVLLGWVAMNCTPGFPHWDSYPFILMNLAMSLQAAYTAPMIMMAQNRESSKDRYLSKSSYFVSAQTDVDVQEVMRLINSQSDQIERLTAMVQGLSRGAR